MGYQKSSDFVLDTIGHCFICLNEIPPRLLPNKLESNSAIQESSTYSLQYLSRYLKINMKKVFHDENVSIPVELLEKVQRSKLKVSLCNQCALWNAKLSELYRQMEKIEVEAVSYLELIHRQLLEAKETGKSEVFHKLDESDYSDAASGLRDKLKLEISEAIRSDTIQKCSNKLNELQPTIKVRKLAEEEIISRTNRCKKSVTLSIEQNINNCWTIPEPNSTMADDNVKSEYQIETEVSSEIGNDYSEDFDDAGGHCDGSERPQLPTLTEKYDEPNIIPSFNYKQHVRKCETGKLVCNLCFKEFADMTGFTRHYQSVHMNIRFQCQICNKIFSNKGNLTAHQRSVHYKQRVKCQFCSKSFTSTANKIHHLRQGKCIGSRHPSEKSDCR